MHTPSLYLKSGLLVLLCTSSLLAKKQVFTLDEDKVIHATASSIGRTRISFQGDRLKEAMGLPNDVDLEKDEDKGILYLGAIKDHLSLSLVSENGLVQDMELTPSKERTSQIVLRDVFQAQIDGDKDYLPRPPLSRSQYGALKVSLSGPDTVEKTYHQKNLALIGKLYHGEGEELSDVAYTLSHSDLSLTYKKSLSGYGFIAHLFEVKNTSSQAISLCEKDFYQKGITSIALSHKGLNPKQTGYVFVVMKGL